MGLLLFCMPQTLGTENCDCSGFLQWVYIETFGPEFKEGTNELKMPCLNQAVTPNCCGLPTHNFLKYLDALGWGFRFPDDFCFDVSRLWFQREML